MIVAFDLYGKELGRYDSAREIEEDYPDKLIVIHNGKAIVK